MLVRTYLYVVVFPSPPSPPPLFSHVCHVQLLSYFVKCDDEDIALLYMDQHCSSFFFYQINPSPPPTPPFKLIYYYYFFFSK